MRRPQVIILVGGIGLGITILESVISNQIKIPLPIAVALLIILLIAYVLIGEHPKNSGESPAHTSPSNSDASRSIAGNRVQYVIAVLVIVLLTFGGLALSQGTMPFLPPGGGGSTPGPSTPSPTASANIVLDGVPSPSAFVSINWSSRYPGYIVLTLQGFPTGSYEFVCEKSRKEGQEFTVYIRDIFMVSVAEDPQTIDNENTCHDATPGDSVNVFSKADPLIGSKGIMVGIPAQIPTPTPTPPLVTPTPTPLVPSYSETTGGMAHTWSNYIIAGGTEGPPMPAYATIQVSCKVLGFKVADGNPWWYRIQSSPWNNQYYASADAFYNTGQTTGSLAGTPFVDPTVPTC